MALFTNGGSSSNTFCIPSVIVVLFNQERHPQGLYSAVETGMTFFSLPSFTLTFLPPSLARPGTSAGAGDGRLNVYDAIRSSVIHSRTSARAKDERHFSAFVAWRIPQTHFESGINYHLRIGRCSGLPRRHPNPAST